MLQFLMIAIINKKGVTMACGCKDGSRLTLELHKVIEHDQETFSFEFKSPDNIKWKEGDSSKVYINVGGKEMGKKFSYATVHDENIIRFTTRIREQASEYKRAFAALEVGDPIEVSEPSGEFHLIREDRPILVLSNGVGIASSRALGYAYSYDRTNIPMMTMINVNNSSELYQEEFNHIKEELKYFSVHYAKDRKQYYESLDFVLQSLMTYVSDDPIIYVVGSRGFVDGTIEHLVKTGMGYRDIITDNHFASSGCGCPIKNHTGSNIINFELPAK